MVIPRSHRYIHTHRHFLENVYFDSGSSEMSKIIEIWGSKNFTVTKLTLPESKIDLIASKFLVEVDFGYFFVEFFGQNDWSINFRYLRLKFINLFLFQIVIYRERLYVSESRVYHSKEN